MRRSSCRLRRCGPRSAEGAGLSRSINHATRTAAVLPAPTSSFAPVKRVRLGALAEDRPERVSLSPELRFRDHREGRGIRREQGIGTPGRGVLDVARHEMCVQVGRLLPRVS